MFHPHIIVPASFNEDQPPAKYHFNKAYTEALEQAGGFPIGVMRPEDADVDGLLDTMDGLFLMGGNDIDPKVYGEDDRACILCEPARDRVEVNLIKKAIERKMPFLGVCRGFQMLNVVLGGNLFQDVEKQMRGAGHHDFHYDRLGNKIARDFLAHEIVITRDSVLGRCTNTLSFRVNSLHHQGIETLGTGLRATAHAPDGLIEAVEYLDSPFCVGVQWHPEELGDEVSTKIFSAFVDAAKKYHETKNRS